MEAGAGEDRGACVAAGTAGADTVGIVRGRADSCTPSTRSPATATMANTTMPTTNRHHAARLQMMREIRKMSATATAGQPIGENTEGNSLPGTASPLPG